MLKSQRYKCIAQPASCSPDTCSEDNLTVWKTTLSNCLPSCNTDSTPKLVEVFRTAALNAIAVPLAYNNVTGFVFCACVQLRNNPREKFDKS